MKHGATTSGTTPPTKRHAKDGESSDAEMAGVAKKLNLDDEGTTGSASNTQGGKKTRWKKVKANKVASPHKSGRMSEEDARDGWMERTDDRLSLAEAVNETQRKHINQAQKRYVLEIEFWNGKDHAWIETSIRKTLQEGMPTRYTWLTETWEECLQSKGKDKGKGKGGKGKKRA